MTIGDEGLADGHLKTALMRPCGDSKKMKNRDLAIKLIGTMPDDQVAQRAGYSRQQIVNIRQAAGVPAYSNPKVQIVASIPSDVQEDYQRAAQATGKSASELYCMAIVRARKQVSKLLQQAGD